VLNKFTRTILQISIFGAVILIEPFLAQQSGRPPDFIAASFMGLILAATATAVAIAVEGMLRPHTADRRRDRDASLSKTTKHNF
jgi:hypothetical protein